MKLILIIFIRLVFLSSIVLGINSCFQHQENKKIFLHSNWRLVMEKDSVNIPAKVPGNVFLDLMNSEIIQDPFFADNEKKVQWVSRKNWIYKTDFSIEKENLKYKNINLVFKGLDTYANVMLNGKEILKANNMFRKWTIPVQDLLEENNHLEIKFVSPGAMDSIMSMQLPYKLPDSRAFTRKAPYQYGWDWGPRLVTMGIWKEVYLEFYDDIRINDVFIKDNNIDNNQADLSAIIEIDSDKKQSVSIRIINAGNQNLISSEKRNLSKGQNQLSLDFSILKPELWWPNGMGKQYLYKFIIRIKTENRIIEKTVKHGLRTVELIQKPDSIGSSFYFEINGEPVFVKGANYIPSDNFPSRIKQDKYIKIIKDAVNSNMNMLRVWGGGIYEKEEFYKLCDEYGILVWQDFMFACNFYPGDSLFVENVKQEAKEQIIRLRNHPSIALWCGNNEIDEAWHNWGYQKVLKYSIPDSIEIWDNYLDLFEKTLPELVKALSPDTDYIPTSPKTGWGHKEAMYSGDMHYWGVWWGEEPFEVYENKVGRFMSEYGFQGFPDIKTLDSVLDSIDLNIESLKLLNHQKHPRGMQLIHEYMKRDFTVHDNLEDYIYVSQLVQSYGVVKAIEAHRRAKPYCMGTLYWQFNDCWPVISWSGIDYYGRWKALQYGVKKAYKKVIVSSEINGDSLDIYIVSDSLGEIKGNMELNFMTFEGENIYNKSVGVIIGENKSRKAISFRFDTIFPENLKNEVVLNILFYSENKIIAEKNIYFVKPKELELSTPEIDVSVSKETSGYIIDLISNKLVKNIQLKPNIDGILSNNYFDMIPRKKYRVELKTSANGYLKIKYQTLNRINNDKKRYLLQSQ